MIRTYVDGDEIRLVELFNKNLAGGLVRTTPSWLWRYAKNPQFDPSGVIVAEENGEIKGCMIGTVRQLLFKGQMATGLVGDDFCVSHDERGKGIGKLILRRFMDFADEKHAVLIGYEEKDSVVHQWCTRLGFSTVDEFAILRKVPGQGEDAPQTAHQNQTPEAGSPRTTRRCRPEDVDEVITFLNLANREKMGAPQLTRSEYAWRYLTYTNSDLDSIFLAEQNGEIVGHVAVTFHPSPREGEERTAILSEPRGAISEILESLVDLRASRVSVAVSNSEIAYYESRGFSTAANGVVVVKNYSGLPIPLSQGAASWYLFSESILGEP